MAALVLLGLPWAELAAAQVLPAGGSVEPPPAPRWESPEADGVALEDPAARVAPRVRRHLRPTAAEARLRPGDLEYAGAFRLPEVEGEPPQTWDWGGQAIAFRPDGDPGGGSDGFPGSLLVTGIETDNHVAEIGIPSPSRSRVVAELPAATMLQPFGDVRSGLFAALAEQARVGMEVLPAQAGQSTSHLYLTWGQNLQFDEQTIVASHAWCGLDLAHPGTAGPWWVGSLASNREGFIYRVNAYLLAIPEVWADRHLGGRRLGTGRCRSGGISGLGPSLVAVAPWQSGTPEGQAPPPGTELPYSPLLLYSHVADEERHALAGCNLADEWEGGAWVEAGERAALLMVGTKAGGYSWYGFPTPQGIAPPPLFGEGAPCPYQEGELVCYQPDGVTPCTAADLQPCAGAAVDPESRGWRASRADAMVLLYDTADLEAVAAGAMPPHAPQPYARLDIDEHLFLNATAPDITPIVGTGSQRILRVSETTYDREHNLLYVLEPFADEARPVVHVWRVR